VSQFAPLARRLLPRARIVLHMHCDWLRDLPAPAARARLADVDLVLGVSDYIGGRISEGFPEVAHRVRTLHNGVDTDLYAPGAHDRAALRRSRQLGEGPVFLYVGAIAPEKGTHVLLQAFAQVGQALPDARLVLVGSPNRYFQVRSRRGRRARAEARLEQRNYAGEAERLASLCGGRVLLAGQRPPEELREWYALADVLVMPSTGEEPFPLPVLEALASALPVVATVRGGLPEIVLDGRTGRLVAAGDVEGLAEALVHLGRDPDLRAELGRRGRELVCERFSWTHQAEVLAGYYRELVAAAEPVSQVGA
jgi:glycosyltransferase involved in cell wall biosynthesis